MATGLYSPREAIDIVLQKFEADEAAGFRSRDRQFAIAIFREVHPPTVAHPTSQMILDSRINVFFLQLLSESLAGKKDIKTFSPISFEYRGVIYTLEPAPVPQEVS